MKELRPNWKFAWMLFVLALLATTPVVAMAQSPTPGVLPTPKTVQAPPPGYPPASPGPDIRYCGDINFFPPLGSGKEGETQSYTCTRNLAMHPLFLNAPLTCGDMVSTVLITIGTGKFTGSFVFHGAWSLVKGLFVVQKAGGYGVGTGVGYSIDYVWQSSASTQAITLDTQLQISNDLYTYSRHHTTTAIPSTGQVITSDDPKCDSSVINAKG